MPPFFYIVVQKKKGEKCPQEVHFSTRVVQKKGSPPCADQGLSTVSQDSCYEQDTLYLKLPASPYPTLSASTKQFVLTDKMRPKLDSEYTC